jgi:hypothetical protein
LPGSYFQKRTKSAIPSTSQPGKPRGELDRVAEDRDAFKGSPKLTTFPPFSTVHHRGRIEA